MVTLQKSTASQIVYTRLFDATDRITPETGVTAPTLTLSKNGSAFAALSDGTWAEPTGGNGVYTIQLNATDTNTAGEFVVRVVKTGIQDAYVEGLVERDVDGISLLAVLKTLYAFARGRLTKSGDTYSYYEQDNTTILYNLKVEAEERTET